MIFVVTPWTPMSHYSRVLKVVIDAPPGLHDQELAFWQGALGQELPEIYSAEYHGAFLRGNDLMLLMQRLDSGAPRVHLDIHTDDLDAEVARLERLGGHRRHVAGVDHARTSLACRGTEAACRGDRGHQRQHVLHVGVGPQYRMGKTGGGQAGLDLGLPAPASVLAPSASRTSTRTGSSRCLSSSTASVPTFPAVVTRIMAVLPAS
jgi:hypothetical protein